MFFTTTLMQTIVEQTNLYAKQVMNTECYQKWLPITEEEIWAYHGFTILMPINHLPSLMDYWCTDEVYHYSPVAGRITRDHISWYLHFVDNTLLPHRTDPTFSRLQKVQPVITSVLEACKASYDPSVNLAIDEVMIAFKGRSSIKQYMPKKPTKRGIKVWMKSDSVCSLPV